MRKCFVIFYGLGRGVVEGMLEMRGLAIQGRMQDFSGGGAQL